MKKLPLFALMLGLGLFLNLGCAPAEPEPVAPATDATGTDPGMADPATGADATGTDTGTDAP